MSITIAIASDHAGFELKEHVISHFSCDKYKIIDLGTNSTDSVDYPIYGHKLAEHVASDKSQFGIAICGSGIGISIAANRNKKIRAALCSNQEHAELSRKHNDANIIALGARFTNNQEAIIYIETFLNTEFDGGRHKLRVDKLS